MKQINWKFKKDAEPQGGSDGFWYDITFGGYINPEEILEDTEQLQILQDALEIVQSFEQALGENNLLNDL